MSGLLLAVVTLGALAAGGLALLAAWAALPTSAGAPPTARPEATAAVGASSELPEAEGWVPWERNDDGAPVRWDPCSPIDLVLNTEGAYDGFRADVHEAVAEVRELSGLRIRVAGEVDERPGPRRPVFQPGRYGDDWAPVLVAFAAPGESDLPLTDVDRGLAVPVAVGPVGDRLFVSGQVVLNAERDALEPGAASRADAWGATLRHELGHLLGLDHVDDELQLMYPHATDGAVVWGDGDRRGLRALGGGGCLDAPAPQPVEMGTEPVR